MTARCDIFLAQAKRSTGRDLDLLADEVRAGDHLGDGMLHLQPRVDLEEIEFAARVEHELDRARVLVADRFCDGERRAAELIAQLGRDGR